MSSLKRSRQISKHVHAYTHTSSGRSGGSGEHAGHWMHHAVSEEESVQRIGRGVVRSQQAPPDGEQRGGRDPDAAERQQLKRQGTRRGVVGRRIQPLAPSPAQAIQRFEQQRREDHRAHHDGAEDLKPDHEVFPVAPDREQQQAEPEHQRGRRGLDVEEPLARHGSDRGEVAEPHRERRRREQHDHVKHGQSARQQQHDLPGAGEIVGLQRQRLGAGFAVQQPDGPVATGAHDRHPQRQRGICGRIRLRQVARGRAHLVHLDRPRRVRRQDLSAPAASRCTRHARYSSANGSCGATPGALCVVHSRLRFMSG